MYKFTKSLLSMTLAIGALYAASAQATCTIYADADFKGMSGTVQPNDLLRFNAEGTRDVTLLLRKVRTFRDPAWFEQVSSVQVSGKCEAVFWNRKGSHDRFQTTAQLPAEYDNPALGVLCECK